MNNIITTEQQNKLLEMAQKAKANIELAINPLDLKGSALIATNIKQTIELVKKALKDAEKDPKALIKQLDEQFNIIETQIKDKFLEVYHTETILENKVDADGVLVGVKEKQVDNKGENLFTYTPAKKEFQIDHSQITQEKYPHLFKQVWVIDNEAISKDDALNLPMKEVITPQKVGIQWKELETQLKELENV